MIVVIDAASEPPAVSTRAADERGLSVMVRGTQRRSLADAILARSGAGRVLSHCAELDVDWLETVGVDVGKGTDESGQFIRVRLYWEDDSIIDPSGSTRLNEA